jgi:hypothetical protein
MAMTSQKVSDTGWVEKLVLVRPKTRLFALLSLLWLGVVLVASLPFWTADWRGALSGKFSDVNWLCVLLVIPEVLLVGLALKYRFTEKPVETIRFYSVSQR